MFKLAGGRSRKIKPKRKPAITTPPLHPETEGVALWRDHNHYQGTRENVPCGHVHRSPAAALKCARRTWPQQKETVGYTEVPNLKVPLDKIPEPDDWDEEGLDGWLDNQNAGGD